MKKILMLLTTFIVVLTLSACSKDELDNTEPEVEEVLFVEQDDVLSDETIEQIYLRDYATAEYTYVYPNSTEMAQIYDYERQHYSESNEDSFEITSFHVTSSGRTDTTVKVKATVEQTNDACTLIFDTGFLLEYFDETGWTMTQIESTCMYGAEGYSHDVYPNEPESDVIEEEIESYLEVEYPEYELVSYSLQWEEGYYYSLNVDNGNFVSIDAVIKNEVDGSEKNLECYFGFACYYKNELEGREDFVWGLDMVFEK